MPWGDYGVTRMLRLANSGPVAWAGGGVPTTINLAQAGILRSIRMFANSSAVTLTGGTLPSLDNLAPWNLFSQHVLSPNGLTPIFQVSGYGAYLVNLAKTREARNNTPDTTAVSVTNHATTTDVYAAPTATANPLRFNLQIPVSQMVRSLGGDVGLWPLQNPSTQLVYSFTPNSATATSPYSIYGATAGTAVYTGGATSPAATITSPSVDLWREMYEVPLNKADLPVFNAVSTWVEEAPQGASVLGSSAFTWQAKPLSGYLVRLLVFIYDGSTSTGVASSSLTSESALQITTDATSPKVAESAYAALARQRREYGFDLPQGAFFWDMLGDDLTLVDVLDTYTVANIQFQATLASALGSTGSFAKIIPQVIKPLEVRVA